MARSRAASFAVVVVLLVVAGVALLACPAVAQAHVVARASTNSQGIQADYESIDCAISADGRYVAFRSDSSNLITEGVTLSLPAGTAAGGGAESDARPLLGGALGSPDIYLRDLVAGTTELISAKLDGTKSNHECSDPSVSADGRYIAFSSQCEELVENDTNMLQ
ncbi:MAG: PD40 domain-containing protein, partial [Thermoleophilia bacterium]|nr:PD40 domain-containing protein [Thermoleophilia bacterium]